MVTGGRGVGQTEGPGVSRPLSTVHRDESRVCDDPERKERSDSPTPGSCGFILVILGGFSLSFGGSGEGEAHPIL